MSDLQREFLETLVRRGGLATRSELPLADRAQDRARQKCRREGLAVFESPHWGITAKGRAALSSAK